MNGACSSSLERASRRSPVLFLIHLLSGQARLLQYRAATGSPPDCWRPLLVGPDCRLCDHSCRAALGRVEAHCSLGLQCAPNLHMPRKKSLPSHPSGGPSCTLQAEAAGRCPGEPRPAAAALASCLGSWVAADIDPGQRSPASSLPSCQSRVRASGCWPGLRSA